MFLLPRLDALVAQFPQLAPVAQKIRETPQPEIQLQANAYAFEIFGLPAALFGGNLLMTFPYYRFLQARYYSTPLMRDVAVRLSKFSPLSLLPVLSARSPFSFRLSLSLDLSAYSADTFMQKTPAFLRNIWGKIRPFLP